MLSLPLIIPRDVRNYFECSIDTLTIQQDQTPWHTPSYTTSVNNADDLYPSSVPNHQLTTRPPSRHAPSHNPAPTPLAKLAQDENILRTRTLNVRRFGAGWLRPPGISKTLQAQLDEQAEREEQEIIARREQAMQDYAEAQEREEAAARAAANAVAGEGTADEDEMGERDLDEDIPEADEGSFEDTDSEEDSDDDESEEVSEDEDEPGAEAEVTFNEESLIEGSDMPAEEVQQMLDMEEAEMTGALQEERDLDDDIPEAGSYQHTDTEIEDTTSDDEEDDAFEPLPLSQARAVRVGRGPGPLGERRVLTAGQRIDRTRPPAGTPSSSNLGSSSFIEQSSPVAAREAAARANMTMRTPNTPQRPSPEMIRRPPAPLPRTRYDRRDHRMQ